MLNSMKFALLIVSFLGIVLPVPALAYIGPGTGLGAIAITVAFVLGVLLLVIGLVWYPLKRLHKRISKSTPKSSSTDLSE
jgi:ABC-type transport system involved in cytochrome bd biosynthesis fused ATPase/permease subunit